MAVPNTNVRRLLFAGALACFACGSAVGAGEEVDDWIVTSRSVPLQGRTIFPGCAVHSMDDSVTARRIANLRARVNVIRGRRLAMSGKAALEIDGSRSHLRSELFEESEGFLGPVVVIEEKLVDYHGQRFICQFVAEVVGQ
jgi:hypothetical protein